MSAVVVVLLGAHVAMCCLFAIGIYVQRRSWSDRLCVCYGKCNLEEVFIAQTIIYSRLASASMACKCSRRVYAV